MRSALCSLAVPIGFPGGNVNPWTIGIIALTGVFLIKKTGDGIAAGARDISRPVLVLGTAAGAYFAWKAYKG